MRGVGPGSMVLLAAVVSLSVAPAVTRADEDHPLCRLAVHEESSELEDYRLAADLAEARFVAAEEIFVLVDGLWKNDAIERMAYLGYKHDRDIAKLDLAQGQQWVARQTAVVEQYRLQCRAFAGAGTSEKTRRALEDTWEAYRRADCEGLRLAVEIAKVDLEFRIELLASVHELRAGDVATRQDVVFAERDVQVARRGLAHATERAEACGPPASPPEH